MRTPVSIGRHLLLGTLTLAPLAAAVHVGAGEDGGKGRHLQLRRLDARALPADNDWAKQPGRMVARHAQSAIRAANQRETMAWHKVKTREDWERFRSRRIQALRVSLGSFPTPPGDLKVRVVRELRRDGHRIRNLVFESRPGLVVSANLYLPLDAPKAAAGILICHSHHAPKTQSELQDMGMTWARSGAVVLVMDQLGHGERRQHPFADAASYPKPFRVGRQDYYFRYNAGSQLYLIGDSLMGWMVWDLMRGVDVLLAQPGVARDKIILLGSVAGGGDPATVTAALDARIAAVVPFNFGGPQPETAYPLPDAGADSFNYAGSGSWESTRNLRLSARDGFLPWLLVAAAAPRPLIYGHEFSWDRQHDPVWQRLETIYALYDRRDHLAAAAGWGRIGTKDNGSECTNIGPAHRKLIYPLFEHWFNMPVPLEVRQRLPARELTCLTPEVVQDLKPRPLWQMAAALGEERVSAARRALRGLAPVQQKERLRRQWATLLGDVHPRSAPRVLSKEASQAGGVEVQRIVLETEPGILVPLLLLAPAGKEKVKRPVVVGIAQQGKAALLQRRTEIVVALLDAGIAVCLPDLRGCGETSPGQRGRQSAATSISATELMLGQTLVGQRLADLRSVLDYLRRRSDLDATCLALWGDSTGATNPDDRSIEVPLDVEQPALAEPLGGLLALLGALFEDDVKAAYVYAGLSSYQSMLRSPFVHLPHDAIVPGALTVGDLADVAAALAPRPLRLEGLVDGRCCRVPAPALASTYEPTRQAYAAAHAGQKLQLAAEPASAAGVAGWLRENLAR